MFCFFTPGIDVTFIRADHVSNYISMWRQTHVKNVNYSASVITSVVSLSKLIAFPFFFFISIFFLRCSNYEFLQRMVFDYFFSFVIKFTLILLEFTKNRSDLFLVSANISISICLLQPIKWIYLLIFTYPDYLSLVLSLGSVYCNILIIWHWLWSFK